MIRKRETIDAITCSLFISEPFLTHKRYDLFLYIRHLVFYTVGKIPKRVSMHGVWKSQKKSRSTLRAKRATFTFWVDKSWLKMPEMVQFGEFLKTWSLRSNRVTRQVSFNRTKIGGKCQNWKIQMRHFE